ncbi:hypothetical protein BDV35DRAFT_346761 [Aspergillus flavus]|uniref:Uncharacterized protein n=1 Tax=Aspergillus flavus TaxID=5059 RepID=A0A5N6H5B8_ASPFL|nr:hypothetical protein BDV35DRAFT_346761 [Aspergillus flavus]
MVVWFSSVIVVFFFSGILVSLIVGVNPLIAKSNIIIRIVLIAKVRIPPIVAGDA